MRIQNLADGHPWATLATFDSPSETQELLAVLARAGVETQVQDERNSQRYWFMARPQAGVHLLIPEASLPLARKLLRSDPSARAAFKQAIHCPFCGSSSVQYPQMTRKNYLPTLAAHVLVALHVMEHEYYCEECHYSWPREEMEKS